MLFIMIMIMISIISSSISSSSFITIKQWKVSSGRIFSSIVSFLLLFFPRYMQVNTDKYILYAERILCVTFFFFIFSITSSQGQPHAIFGGLISFVEGGHC